MIRRRKEGGYTLTELMIVLALVGTLAFPEMEYVRTCAKLTGVQTNYRSVLATIYGQRNTEEVAPKLIALFGDAMDPEVEDMTNPITSKMGVATDVSLDEESTPAVYVLDDAWATEPSEEKQPDYKGAVVAIIKADNSVVVYGCDEAGRLMTGFQRTIKL